MFPAWKPLTGTSDSHIQLCKGVSKLTHPKLNWIFLINLPFAQSCPSWSDVSHVLHLIRQQILADLPSQIISQTLPLLSPSASPIVAQTIITSNKVTVLSLCFPTVCSQHRSQRDPFKKACPQPITSRQNPVFTMAFWPFMIAPTTQRSASDPSPTLRPLGPATQGSTPFLQMSLRP